MAVIQGVKAHQTAAQGGGENSQRSEFPDHSGAHEERHDHSGDAGGQTVDAIGEVHGVDAAHDDEGGEDQIHDPVHCQRHVDKGDIEIVGQEALIPHQAQEHHRRQKL